MVTTLIIAGLTTVLMTLSVLLKPYVNIGKRKIGLYWVICLFGALLILLFKCISIKSAISGITANSSVNPIKILVLFLSMTVISLYLEYSGFFDYTADLVFKKIGKGGLKLFLTLYIVVSILTIFTSNDVVILTFTPPICIFCKKAGVSPIPYLFGEFVAANTWSMLFIIGNPTNIYLASSYGVTFFEYFKVMWLPTLCGGLTGLLTLLLLFYKPLLKDSKTTKKSFIKDGEIKVNKVEMTVALITLALCIIFLALSNFIRVEMWLICLTFAFLLTIFDIIWNYVKYKSPLNVIRTIKKAPYELIPFVLSMFIIVLALDECGFTTILKDLLSNGSSKDSIVFGFLSAISSNVLNNIPMSVLFERVVGSSASLYGAVIGSNVGAFITPVGALAGIMWNKILSQYKVKFSFLKFTLYGLTIAIPTLISSTLVLYFII